MKPRHCSRTLLPLAVLALCLPSLSAVAQPKDNDPAHGVNNGPGGKARRDKFHGMVRLAGVEKQPIGMDEAAVLAFLEKDIKTVLKGQPERWEKYWNEIFTLMTPAHTQTVPTTWFSRFEVTNAQWKMFLDHPYNQKTGQTGSGYDTLAAVASAIWGQTGKPLEGADLQRAWIYLMERNRAVLMPLLNPEEAEDWDPLVARAGEAALPPDLDLSYTTYLPPSDWVAGEVPDDALKRPARGISWEAAADFCRWAGLHLPTGAEWERAARGEKGRRFSWGDEWKPMNLVWRGFNKALKAAENKQGLEKIGRERVPSRPADVDSFGHAATPEQVHHLHGNVSEWILDFPKPYVGSKTKFAFHTFAYGARGGNYQDRAEVMLAADRIWDGPGGEALRPGMELDGFGFRTSAYALNGADLTKPVELLFDDQNATKGPPMWMPTPFGLKGKLAKRRSEHFAMMGFNAAGTAGVIQRDLVDGAANNHIYVNGPAKCVAFLPSKGFASAAIRAKGDLKKFAKKDDAVVLLGILVGSPDLSFTIRLPYEVDERGKVSKEVKKKTFSFDDDRFIAPDGSFSKGFRYLGAFVVLTENGIAVFPPDSSNVGNADDYLSDESNAIGYLIEPHIGDWQKVTGGLMREPSASIDDGIAVLTFVIPPLDEKKLTVKKSQYAVRMTITIPIKGW